MPGFCVPELNPFGPLQEYDDPPPEVRFSVLVAQIGLLLEAEAVGCVFTTTPVVAIVEHKPIETVTV